MQSTGHTSTQDLSLVPLHGSVMMYGIARSLSASGSRGWNGKIIASHAPLQVAWAANSSIAIPPHECTPHLEGRALRSTVAFTNCRSRRTLRFSRSCAIASRSRARRSLARAASAASRRSERPRPPAAGGPDVLTVEGLAPPGTLAPLQRAFIAHDATQYGFCTPGQLIAAHALLAASPRPSDDDIRPAMSGNLCRCGTYPKILSAISAVARGEFADTGGADAA